MDHIKDPSMHKKWCRQQRKIEGTQNWIDTEIRATIQHALGQKDNDIDAAVMQVSCLRLAYNLNHSCCALSILRSIIETSCSQDFKDLDNFRLRRIKKNLEKRIDTWKPHILRFCKGTDEEHVLIANYLEDYCRYRFYNHPKVFKTFLPYILHLLYMNDILEEDGLFYWKDVTEEGITESSSSGSSADVIQSQIKYSLAALGATEKLFEWFETVSTETGSESSSE